MAKVSIIKCKDYSKVKESIKESLDLLGGLKRFIKRTDKVLLKPNLCDPVKREQAAVTDPVFIKAVIELIKEITPFVFLADLPALDKEGVTREVLLKSGIMDVLKETETKWVNLEKTGFIAKDIPYFKVMDKTDFSKVYFYSDTIINLPKLKTHGITYITGAIKNMFGLIHMQERKYLHSNFNDDGFSQGLVDIYSFMKPKVKLHIMDAVIGMDGDEGPCYGKPNNIGYVLASKDGVAIDAVAAKITGHNPLSILTTKYAHKRKIGIGNIYEIRIVGNSLETVRFNPHTNYKKRNDKLKISKLTPHIDETKCKKCNSCYVSCPVNAIDEIKGNFIINPDKCIKCYCCVESCIYGAIRLKELYKEGNRYIQL